MSLLYKVELSADSTFDFTTDSGDNYSAYFSEYHLSDVDGNDHLVYNFGFYCNGSFSIERFSRKYDPKIQSTLTSIVVSFFEKKEHTAVLYFCFGDDQFARHRHIVFRKWCKDLPANIEHLHQKINLKKTSIYTSILILTENPLKRLITDSYKANLEEIREWNEESGANSD